MNWTQIEVLSISDIHLGHTNNPAEYVISGLEKKLTIDYLAGVDLLFIVGDVFDKGLSLNHHDVFHIVAWIKRLLQRCANLNITVIVLEGTPSHDRMQSQLFVAINDSSELKCDLRYIKEVSTEYIEKYDLNILCIPDEKNTDDDITYYQLLDIMKSKAIEKCDFGLVHGFFDFQVPEEYRVRYHDSNRYLEIVKYLIFVGHDHEYNKKDRIIVQGSPDRQRFGMESNKGFVRAMVYRDGTYHANFVVNEYAMRFDTLELKDNVQEALKQIKRKCKTLTAKSHLRLVGHKDHPILESIGELQKEYPLIKISKKYLENENKNILLTESNNSYIPFVIDKSNIKQLVKERLSIDLNDKELDYFNSLMDNYI